MKALKTLIALGLMTTIASSAVAYQPAIREQQNYYSDAGYTTLVGQFTELCDGSYHWWGELSAYSQFYYGNC